MKRTYNKLVRDKIPKIIRDDDAEPVIQKLEEPEYVAALKSKVIEEANELLNEAETKEQVIEEMADVFELLRALAAHYDITLEDIAKVADKKKAERGGFEKQLFLKSIEE